MWTGEWEARGAGQCHPFPFPLRAAGSQGEGWEVQGPPAVETERLGGSFTGAGREQAGG